MRRREVLAMSSAVLALGLAILDVGRGADDTGPRAKVDQLAAVAVKDPAALQKQAAAYAKGVELAEVKELFKKRLKNGKGGYGIGPIATGAFDDGIEARIQNYAKKAPTADQLKKNQADLEQMVNRVKAVAAITVAKVPTKAAPGKDPKEWKELAGQMVAESDALGKAIEAGDPKAVKSAATKLNASCTDCHGKFRD
jgi:soluble cytochrome b562